MQDRRYGFMPYAAICDFDLFLDWRLYIWHLKSKSAIHVIRLTIHEADVRTPSNFSDKLVEDWR